MTDERLRSLQRRFRETGTEADELAFLRELARTGGREQLELATRFGCPRSARALGLEPGPPPRALSRRLSVADSLAQFGGSWEAALVYFRVALEGVVAAWRERGSQYADTLLELQPMADAVQAWFDGERGEEASNLALPWVQSTAARAELMGGRFDVEGRALRHLIWGLGSLAYACAPSWAPFHSHRPQQQPRREDGTPLTEDEVRQERVCGGGLQHEVFEAIMGLMYMDHPRLDMTDPDYGERVDATLQPFEALAAKGLVRWVLGGR